MNHCDIKCKSYGAQRKRYALDTVHSPLVFYMKTLLCSVYIGYLLILRISPRNCCDWSSIVMVIWFPLTSHIIQLEQWDPGRNKLCEVSRKTFGFLIKWEIKWELSYFLPKMLIEKNHFMTRGVAEENDRRFGDILSMTIHQLYQTYKLAISGLLGIT